MISLSAEQRNLLQMFTQREQYIIPDFQRPYRWGKDQCQKLYDDLIEAYSDYKSYFLGNVVLAVADRQIGQPNVIDGQQRLISLWLIFKVLSILLPKIRVFDDMLYSVNWDGSRKDIKIKSDVVEADDYKDFDAVANWTQSYFQERHAACTDQSGTFNYPKLCNKIEANSLFFYHLFSNFYTLDGETALVDFVRFILENVSLLPIQMTDTDLDEAKNKALTVFETINDRGLDLADADIFKAKLCAKAITEHKKDDFMRLWSNLKSDCVTLQISIDDVFRYYSHILRGLNKNTRSETNLREFFTATNSPISQKSYQGVMSDLCRITSILLEYQERKCENNELAAWLQLVDIYTNIYPKYALVTYLYHHGFDNVTELLSTIQSIVRYCYFKGSTTSIKFEIYNMIQMISYNQALPSYSVNSDLVPSDFMYLGRLKYAYALLAFYLEHPCAIQNYQFDRLLTSRDYDYLSKDWYNESLDQHLDDIGNLVVLDTYKRTKSYKEKRVFYMNTKFSELRNFLEENESSISFNQLKERTEYKQKLLVNFFIKE